MSAISRFDSASNAFQVQSQRGNFFDRMKADMQSALASSGVDQSKISDVMGQIQDALANFMQGGGNGRSSKDTVHDILQANGIDTQKFDDALKSLNSRQRTQRAVHNDGITPNAATSKLTKPAQSSSLKPGKIDIAA